MDRRCAAGEQLVNNRNELRSELQTLLMAMMPGKTPTLHRSRQEDALYAVRLPAGTGEEAVEAFRRAAEAAGWSVRQSAEWLEMDKPVHKSPAGHFAGPFGPEAGCLLRLMQTHGETDTAEGKSESLMAARQLVKAGEKGPGAYERACRALHQAWAIRLREHRPLPAMDAAFFQKEESEGEEC